MNIQKFVIKRSVLVHISKMVITRDPLNRFNGFHMEMNENLMTIPF